MWYVQPKKDEGKVKYYSYASVQSCQVIAGFSVKFQSMQNIITPQCVYTLIKERETIAKKYVLNGFVTLDGL